MNRLLLTFLIFSFSFNLFSQENTLKIKAGKFSVMQKFNVNISENNKMFSDRNNYYLRCPFSQEGIIEISSKAVAIFFCLIMLN